MGSIFNHKISLKLKSTTKLFFNSVFTIMMSLIIVSPSAFANPSLEIDVKLSPAGSFKAKTTKIKGLALTKENQIMSEKALVDLRTLETGIELRDKHLKQRLLVDKFPMAKLIKAQGKDGKGQAIISLMGKQHKVVGTYKTKGNFVTSEFPMKLSALGINDANYMGIGAKDEVIVTITLPVEEWKAPTIQRGLSSVEEK